MQGNRPQEAFEVFVVLLAGFKYSLLEVYSVRIPLETEE
jgi:hypothetical protein